MDLQETHQSFPLGMILLSLAGGLAFFLYGLHQLSNGLRKSSGEGLRKMLARMTASRYAGFATGAVFTAVVQSSSATTVMLVGLVKSGILNYSQCLGVILGADVGTTITAQLIAFRLSDYSLIMVITGFLLATYFRRDTWRHAGEAILGFGILFFGMKMMSDAISPLKSYGPVLDFLQQLEHPVTGLVAGLLMTAILQSSSAFIGILIVISQQGLLTLESGIPLILGANIGTCITAMLASMGAGIEAGRVALAHVVFKVAGVMVFVFWIPDFAHIIREISPTDYSMSATATETPRQIANAHSLFNVSIGLLFLPFTRWFDRLNERLLPPKTALRDKTPYARKLDTRLLSTPGLAIDMIRRQIALMAEVILSMLERVIDPLAGEKASFRPDNHDLPVMDLIHRQERKVDIMQDKITAYLLLIARQQLSERQSREVHSLIVVVKYLESIGDIVDRSLKRLAVKRESQGIELSQEGREEIRHYHEKACKQIHRLIKVFSERDIMKAEKIVAREISYDEMEKSLGQLHLDRLTKQRHETVASHEVHMDIMEALRQVHIYAVEIARIMLATLPLPREEQTDQ
ncbi:MAG: Na/Pi cotransporter family protein [Bacteroidales bacterium]|nr:Na/Pi cotransporter family protein [Bacteroidales bacterium]